MDSATIWTIVSAGLALVAAVAGGFLLKAKGKLAQLITLGQEIVDVVEALDAALADNNVTASEVEAIKQELLAVKEAFKLLVGKA
jgi:hypothetical protein